LKKIIYSLIIFILSGTFSNAQDQYRLVNFINKIEGNKIVFYNFIQDSGKLLISSSLGVFQIEDSDLTKVSDITGPVNLIGGEIITISGDDIVKSNDYNYLLEFNTLDKSVPTQKIDNQVFMIVNGSLRIYKTPFYNNTFENLSVRSITKNYVGSYSGIFQKENGLKISEIQTNSHIRELNSGVYVCYSALAKIEDDKTIFFRNQYEEIEVLGKSLGSIVDILSVSGNYILFTTKGVYSTDLTNYINPITVNEEDQNPFDRSKWPKFITIYENIDNFKIVQFYFNKTIFNYYPNTKDINPIIRLKEEVKSLVYYDDFVYLLDNKNLKKVRQGRREVVLIKNIQDYHSFLPISRDRILLFSDLGIWLYDLVKNSRKLITTEEVNYGAFYKENNNLAIGTTNGILNFKITDLENISIEFDNKPLESTSSNGYLYFLLILSTATIGYLLSFKVSRPSIPLNTTTNLKEAIDNYIENNLAVVSVKSIETEFNISYTKIKSLYQSPSIGKIIKTKREQLVFELIESRESVSEISAQTGYSESYLKKRIKLITRNNNKYSL